MNAAQFSALSLCLAQQNADLALIAPVPIAAPSGEEAAPRNDDGSRKLGPVSAPLPTAGTLEAKGFVLAMRNAGRRTNEKGVSFTDQSKVREDKIRAMAAFGGYDTTGNFGAQELDSLAKANREIKNPPRYTGPTRQEQRQINRSLSGFQAGLPVPIKTVLDNLLAREVVAVEAMLEHEKIAGDFDNRSQAERELAEGMADFERNRLEAIRADIRRLVG